MAARLKNLDRNTPMLMSPDLRDWVRDDHIIHFIIDAVDQLPREYFQLNHRGTGDEQYVVMHHIRSVRLKGTQLAHAQFDTIRLRLLKIGTRVESGKTRILLHFPSAFANIPEFESAVLLNTG